MISERQERHSSQPLPNVALQHSKSAPSPMALLKPLPEKKKLQSAAAAAGDYSEAAAGSSGVLSSAELPGASAGRIHSSFSGLIVGSDFGGADAGAGDAADAAEAAAAAVPGNSGPVVLDPERLRAAVQQRAAAQQQQQQHYGGTPGGYLSTPVSLSATPSAGIKLPPRPVPRPPAQSTTTNQPWIQEQEQAWCI